jgi:tRNA 2-thiocytidine biosynthesis protein TtcA
MSGLEKRICSRIDKAVWENKMFSDGDHIIIAVSGGADSMALAHLLKNRYTIYAKDLRLTAAYVDMGFGEQANQRCRMIEDYFKHLQLDYRIERTNIGPYSHREDMKQNPCFVCSRLRRKKIFQLGNELGAQKLVFGHHKNDVAETLLLNIVFGRQISSFLPVMRLLEGKFTIVRPLFFTEEEKIKRFVHQKEIPVIDQQCPTDGHSKRQYIKELMQKIEKDYPGARENIFKSIKHVKTEYLFRP